MLGITNNFYMCIERRREGDHPSIHRVPNKLGGAPHLSLGVCDRSRQSDEGNGYIVGTAQSYCVVRQLLGKT